MNSRCVVCGVEAHCVIGDGRVDVETGGFMQDVPNDVFVWGDGLLAVGCVEHTDDERRAAYVLTERTLRQVAL